MNLELLHAEVQSLFDEGIGIPLWCLYAIWASREHEIERRYDAKRSKSRVAKNARQRRASRTEEQRRNDNEVRNADRRRRRIEAGLRVIAIYEGT
jgi:hypothetical protein